MENCDTQSSKTENSQTQSSNENGKQIVYNSNCYNSNE